MSRRTSLLLMLLLGGIVYLSAGTISNHNTQYRNNSSADVAIDFGDPSPTSGLSFRDVCCKSSLQIISNPVRDGDKAAKFVLKPSHNFSRVGNIYKTRNEVLPSEEMKKQMDAHNITTKGQESWYGFSIRPKENLYISSTFEVLFQLHHVNDDCDTRGGPPPVALYVVGDSYKIRNFWDQDKCQENWSKVTEQGSRSWRFPLNRGEWTDWVIHTNWKHTPQGYLEVWRNGEKVITRNGPVTYNDESLFYFQFGIYKSPWLNNPRKSTRVYYFDDLRMSGGSGSYKDVAPGQN